MKSNINWGVKHLSANNHFWVIGVTVFSDKTDINLRRLWKCFLQKKKKFPQSPESIKRHSNENNGPRSAIKYI